MAIFHLSAKIISRGKGQSAIAAAAYRSGERLRDEQANEQKFYQTRAERIEFTEILAPKDAPEWAHDRNALWNNAERAEKRKDAQLAREIEVSLPHELTAQQREWLVKDFAREAFVRKGFAVDIAIHAPDKESDQRNHHAHLMVTRRTLGADGFAPTKDWKRNPQELAEWREQWAHLANRHFERHGHAARIDHRSLKEQGIDREAGVHLGYAANEMAQRGAQSDRMDKLKGVIERNDIRLEMAALDREAAELGRRLWRRRGRSRTIWKRWSAWRRCRNWRARPRPTRASLWSRARARFRRSVNWAKVSARRRVPSAATRRGERISSHGKSGWTSRSRTRRSLSS